VPFTVCQCYPSTAVSVYLGGILVAAGTIIVLFQFMKSYEEQGLREVANTLGIGLIGAGTVTAFFDQATHFVDRNPDHIILAVAALIPLGVVLVGCGSAPFIAKRIRDRASDQKQEGQDG
jgi:multisubunit Na+/H+ antiporter MnhG subunit